MTDYEEVREIAKIEDKRSCIRLTISRDMDRSKHYIHFRRWYLDGDELKPGKGLTLPARLLPQIEKAFHDAIPIVEEYGMRV